MEPVVNNGRMACRRYSVPVCDTGGSRTPTTPYTRASSSAGVSRCYGRHVEAARREHRFATRAHVSSPLTDSTHNMQATSIGRAPELYGRSDVISQVSILSSGSCALWRASSKRTCYWMPTC